MGKIAPSPWFALPEYKGNWGVKSLPIDHFLAGPIDEEDARLIASAPDMLEALEAVRDHIGFDPWNAKESDEVEVARDLVAAAIAKAKGES